MGESRNLVQFLSVHSLHSSSRWSKEMAINCGLDLCACTYRLRKRWTREQRSRAFKIFLVAAMIPQIRRRRALRSSPPAVCWIGLQVYFSIDGG